MIQKTYSILVLLLVLSSAVYAQEADSTSYGWLSFQTNIDTFHVVIDQDFANPFYIQGDSIQIESGEHSLILVHPSYEDIRSEINIKPNTRHALATEFRNKIEKDSTLSSYKRITEGLAYNITIITDKNSSIVIDDSTYGKGYLQTDIGPYEHRIEIKHPTARDRSEEIYINPSGQQKLVLFTKPKRSLSLLLGLVPSASQWYKNQKLKGTVLTVSTLGISIFALTKTFDFIEVNNEYKSMLRRYQRITEEQKALEYGNLIEQKYNEVKRTAKIRDISLATLIGLYIYNLTDAILCKPQSGYQVNIHPANIFFIGEKTIGLKMKVSF